MKKGAQVERLIFIAVALMLAPMLLYTSYLVVLSLQEGSKYRNAPDIAVAGTTKGYGIFYHAQGPLTGALLNPEDFPEIKDGLQTKVTREVLDPESKDWKKADKKAEWSRIHDISIGGQPVVLTSASRLMIESVTQTVTRSETERFIIEQQQVHPVDYVAFGMYVEGNLQDGHHERLIVTPASELEATLHLIDRSGKKKAVILALLSAVFAIFIALILRAAFRKTPKAACCAH